MLAVFQYTPPDVARTIEKGQAMFSFSPAIPSRSDLDWCWYLRRQGRAGEAIERVLHNIGVMHPGGWADWSASSLTDTGSPVEVVFSTHDKAVTLTTEVDNPSHDPNTRFGQVCRIMADLGGTPPDAALRDVISAAQGAAKLHYGARLGLRHDGNTLSTMLFAELPTAASDLSTLMSQAPFEPILQTLGPSARTTMLGYDGTTRKVTIFCEADGVKRTILPALCGPAQVSPDVLSMSIDGMTDAAPSIDLPTQKLRFSYTIGATEFLPTLSLAFSSKALFGTDDAIERRVRACSFAKQAHYTQLLENLPVAPKGIAHHGDIHMTARKDAAPAMSINVAAPWDYSG